VFIASLIIATLTVSTSFNVKEKKGSYNFASNECESGNKGKSKKTNLSYGEINWIISKLQKRENNIQ